jgi:hypothetical protein
MHFVSPRFLLNEIMWRLKHNLNFIGRPILQHTDGGCTGKPRINVSYGLVSLSFILAGFSIVLVEDYYEQIVARDAVESNRTLLWSISQLNSHDNGLPAWNRTGYVAHARKTRYSFTNPLDIDVFFDTVPLILKSFWLTQNGNPWAVKLCFLLQSLLPWSYLQQQSFEEDGSLMAKTSFWIRSYVIVYWPFY